MTSKDPSAARHRTRDAYQGQRCCLPRNLAPGNSHFTDDMNDTVQFRNVKVTQAR